VKGKIEGPMSKLERAQWPFMHLTRRYLHDFSPQIKKTCRKSAFLEWFISLMLLVFTW
jgi:hypothetical protein